MNSTPLFEALKIAVPEAFIAVSCSGITAGVLRHNPYIDLVIETPHALKNTTGAARVIRRALRDNDARVECVVTSSWNRRSRLAFLAVLAGPYLRLGHTLAEGLYHGVVPYRNDISVIENNLNLLPLLQREVTRTKPRVFFSNADWERANEMLTGGRVDPDRPLLVFVTQTSGSQPSNWYDDRFIALADYLVANFGAQIVFVGTKNESERIEKVRQGMKGASLSLAGKTDIPTLAALMARSDLTIAVDTGSMHVARAVRVPLVIIAPAWQPAFEWLPLGEDLFQILRRNDIGCRHCRKFVCETRECMDEISTQDVILAAVKSLRDYPVSQKSRDLRVQHSLNGTFSTDRASSSVLDLASV